MPFTPSHAVVALPFVRTPLVPAAISAGVLSFLILAQSGMVGAMHSPVDITYLSDTVLLLRYFEAGGEIHQALSVFKKRTGAHERTHAVTCRVQRCGERATDVAARAGDEDLVAHRHMLNA